MSVTVSCIVLQDIYVVVNAVKWSSNKESAVCFLFVPWILLLAEGGDSLQALGEVVGTFTAMLWLTGSGSRGPTDVRDAAVEEVFRAFSRSDTQCENPASKNGLKCTLSSPKGLSCFIFFCFSALTPFWSSKSCLPMGKNPLNLNSKIRIRIISEEDWDVVAAALMFEVEMCRRVTGLDVLGIKVCGHQSEGESCLWIHPRSWFYSKHFPNQDQIIEHTCWRLSLQTAGVWGCRYVNTYYFMIKSLSSIIEQSTRLWGG